MTKRLCRLCFSLTAIFLWLQVSLWAQTEYQVNTYTTKDGLSSQHCRRLLKDKEGFLWISSDKGLNRYDGNSIYVFTHRPDDPNSIASNNCNGLLEDKKGRLWINSSEGLSLFDKKKQVFTNFYPDTTLISVSGHGYSQMAEDHQGNIWLGGYNDVLIFNPNSKKFTKSGWYDYGIKSGIIKYEIRNNISHSVVKKSENEFWILTVYGLFSVHTVTMKYNYYPNPEVGDYFAFNISHIDENGKLWIGTYDKYYYTFDPKNHVWAHHVCPDIFKTFSNQILEIKPFGTDTLMMIRYDIIVLYDVKKQSYSTFSLKEADEGVKNGYYLNVYISGDHIYLLNTAKTSFIHLWKKPMVIKKRKIALPKNFRNNYSYYTKNGSILTGDWDKNVITLCGTNGCMPVKDQNGNDQLGTFQLYFYSKSGQEYFSTSKAIYRLNVDKNQAILMEFSKGYQPSGQTEFRNFVEDASGNIYIRERIKGIFVISQGSSFLKPLDLPIHSTEYTALYCDKVSNKLWLASEKNGLYIIDPKKNTVKNYPLVDNHSTKKGFINDISGDSLGNIFLIMINRGLMVINSLDMKAKLYTTNDGLATSLITFGYYGGKDIFWLTSESGIIAFDYKKERFYNFEDESEAKLMNFRLFPDLDGNICQNLFPHQIISLDKNCLEKSEFLNGKLYLKEATLFGQLLPSDSIFNLLHYKNNLALNFGYLLPKSSQKPNIEYRINEQNWLALINNWTISMYNMVPGSYQIEVRLKYHPETSKTIKIQIAYPWWQTWWFYTIVSALVISIGYWAYKKRILYIRKEEAEKNQLKERIAKIEMSALRAQMNPHFIFNCLNSINRFILVNDTDAASEYLTKFSRLIRMILDASREDFISLDKELAALKLYIGMESMRFQDSFDWAITVEDTVFSHNIMLPPLLIQPYVENAIWHGLMQAPEGWGVKKLAIRVHQQDETVIIDIEDNGIGRAKAKMIKSKTGDQHKSYGISLTEERLRLMEKMQGTHAEIQIEDLTDSEGKACGTKVKITINQ